MNAQESVDEKWRPVLGIEAVILSVISMLNDPNIDSPANMEAML
jgi:ubiquitin-conjugating enzyme E2 G1